jgi:general secretion pathway protein L
VREVQSEIESLTKQLDILKGAQGKRVTDLLKELSDLIPTEAYLTAFNLRGDRLTLEGQARSASEIITALERSKRFKDVKFVSPTTRVGDKERFNLQAEVAW